MSLRTSMGASSATASRALVAIGAKSKSSRTRIASCAPATTVGAAGLVVDILNFKYATWASWAAHSSLLLRSMSVRTYWRVRTGRPGTQRTIYGSPDPVSASSTLLTISDAAHRHFLSTSTSLIHRKDRAKRFEFAVSRALVGRDERHVGVGV